MKPVIGSLMLLLVFLMVIHSFWKWSRQFPPAFGPHALRSS